LGIGYTTTKPCGKYCSSIYSTSDRLNLDAENESLNGNVLFEKLPKYYKLTAGINELGRNFVLNRRLVNGNTQNLFKALKMSITGTTALQHSSKIS
jgi:hypothetical protein